MRKLKSKTELIKETCKETHKVFRITLTKDDKTWSNSYHAKSTIHVAIRLFKSCVLDHDHRDDAGYYLLDERGDMPVVLLYLKSYPDTSGYSVRYFESEINSFNKFEGRGRILTLEEVDYVDPNEVLDSKGQNTKEEPVAKASNNETSEVESFDDISF